MRPLTPTQERFCQEYVVDLNGSAAYRRAYPGVRSEATARANAARLLAKASVADRVAELQRERSARTGIDQDWALARLKLEAEYTGPGASHAARVAAIGLAMRHLGMVTDRVSVEVSLPDVSDIPDDTRDRLLGLLRPAFAPPALAGAREGRGPDAPAA